MNNKLTVFILTYNRALYLKKCITSVLQQTYRDFKLVILDNHSTDETQSVVDSFDDERITYIRHKENIGSYGNSSYAYDSVQSEYYVVFHDDDIMKENFLENELSFMESHPDCGCVGCKATVIDSNDKVVGRYFKESSTIDISCGEDVFKAYIRNRRVYLFPTLMYRTSIMNSYSIRPDEKTGPCGDVVIYCKIALMGSSVAELPEELIFYRMHSGQDSFVNRDSMHIQLFEYFNTNPLFKPLILKYKNEQKNYFRITRGGVIEDFMYDKVDKNQSKKRLREYSRHIFHRKIDLWVGLMTIQITSIWGTLLKKMYKCYAKKNIKIGI